MHSFSRANNLCYIDNNIISRYHKITVHKKEEKSMAGLGSDCQIIFEWMLNNNIMTIKWISHYVIFKIKYLSFYIESIFFLLFSDCIQSFIMQRSTGFILNSSHILKSWFIYLFYWHNMRYIQKCGLLWAYLESFCCYNTFHLKTSISMFHFNQLLQLNVTFIFSNVNMQHF